MPGDTSSHRTWLLLTEGQTELEDVGGVLGGHQSASRMFSKKAGDPEPESFLGQPHLDTRDTRGRHAASRIHEAFSDQGRLMHVPPKI